MQALLRGARQPAWPRDSTLCGASGRGNLLRLHTRRLTRWLRVPQSGKTVKLSAFRKQSLGPLTLNAGKNVVLFFYPADATPGCTKEACAFRDSYSDFKSAGAVVLGVSSDSAESHASFADANDLPFPLLVDEGDEVRSAYGVQPDLFGLIKGRETFVINADGEVVLSFNNQFAPDDHVKKALAVLGA